MQNREHLLPLDRLEPDAVRLLLAAEKATVERVSCVLGPHGPNKLADSLGALLGALGDGFKAYLSSIKDSPAYELEAEVGISGFVRCLCDIHDNYLQYLLPPEPNSFPVEVLHPMKDVLIRFGGYPRERISFGLLHSDRYNFRVARLVNPLKMITDQLQDVLQITCTAAIKKEIKRLPQDFVFLTYPQAEGRNIFLQGILYHELGHTVDWGKSISKGLFKNIKWRGDDPDLPNIFEGWVREITADLVATRLAGPCVLFSTRLAGLTGGVFDKDSHTHPSSRFRLRWMLDHLGRLGYMQEGLAIKTSAILRAWHDQMDKPAAAPNSSRGFATVRSVLTHEEVARALHAAVERGLDGAAYDAESFVKHVPGIVENFRAQLPHCGEGVALESHMASVFNAVWEESFGGPRARGSLADPSAYRETICGLALKSIEGNYIQALWNK